MADEDRALTESEKKARKKADRERKRQEARDAAEKKKRFGLTPEKKRKLRLLIMKMATENLKGEQQRRLEARKNYIEQRLKPLDDLHSLSDSQLKSLCQELHNQLKVNEESRLQSILAISVVSTKNASLQSQSLKYIEVNFSKIPATKHS
jgi:hypothetical protein